MDSFDTLFCSDKKINVEDLLLEIDLPVRLINILKKQTFYSKEDFFKACNLLSLKHTSNYLFPGKLVSFYPRVIENCASHDLMCNLSGSKIKKGSYYYTYHPFIENLENGRVYTIKKRINAELGFIDLFPQDLFSYEEWYYKIKNAYYDVDSCDAIDFYSLSMECGEDCLELYMLGVSKSRRKV